MRSMGALYLLVAIAMTACGGIDAPSESGTAEQAVIVGPLNWQSAASASGAERARAKAVGYLSTRGGACSAWLVARDLIVTNEHCVPCASMADGARISFDWEEGTERDHLNWYDCATVVSASEAYDAAVLRCAPKNGKYPGDEYGWLSLSASDPREGEAIYVIHNSCDIFADPSCSPTKKCSPGTILNGAFRGTDASYDADTLNGSSGAPVLSSVTHEVVALHHYGFGSDGYGHGTRNSGVRASLLRAMLEGIAHRGGQGGNHL